MEIGRVSYIKGSAFPRQETGLASGGLMSEEVRWKEG